MEILSMKHTTVSIKHAATGNIRFTFKYGQQFSISSTCPKLDVTTKNYMKKVAHLIPLPKHQTQRFSPSRVVTRD
jgi:hypothetical protein